MAQSRGITSELWAFMRQRKKLWLAPLIFVMLLVGGLLVKVSSGRFIVPRTLTNVSMPEISRRARRLRTGLISSPPEKPMRPSRSMSKRRPWNV